MLHGSGPIGVVLAGGRGRRMGGDKAGVLLQGQPLVQWVVDALGAVLPEVVIACRMDTVLPALHGVTEAWIPQRAEPGPVSGLRDALREAHGRPVLACAISLPLIRPATVRALASADGRGAGAVVPEVDGQIEALIGRWEPRALTVLDRMAPDASLRGAAHAVGAARLPLTGEPDEFLRVESPEDLLRLDRGTLSRPWAATSSS